MHLHLLYTPAPPPPTVFISVEILAEFGFAVVKADHQTAKFNILFHWGQTQSPD